MRRPEIKSNFTICFGRLSSTKTLIVCSLLIFLTSTAAYAINKRDPDSYKNNLILSSLLNEEHFDVGMSCDEAFKAYKLDEIKSRGKWETAKSSVLGFGEGKRAEPGFSKYSCFAGQFNFVQKIIAVEKTVEQEVVFDNFSQQYGEPDFRREGVNDIRYFLKFNERFIVFSMTLRQITNKTVTTYELEDRTSKIKK